MLQKIAKSKSFDLLGVLIVVAISIASGYLTETLADVTHWGHGRSSFPLESSRLSIRFSRFIQLG